MTGLGGSGDDQTDGPGGDAVALALRIADAVESLTNVWSVAAQGARLRLSPHQLRALRILEAAPGLNLTGLAESMDIGMPTASRLCDRLEAAGLLERVLHPKKRREVQLNLTGPGRQVVGEVAARRSQALAAVLTVMRAEEREALLQGMRAFMAAQEGIARGADRGPEP
ncbi:MULTISPECIES: MarR family winged helix-turn-helix transcriptional regulator [Streptomycetaceae]|uniref:MarR-family transcriptional regulator n=1 Tax=Streptantibioticus cattleyicolor (strain ATCC 35852 / DSM 46488 / JCM 4925 / NBRC 14057 / NRRL 8057) TaxID=1003195 RepID=F8K3S1_STREN|nr:MarR family transcriptional regulator [Streptantibioticus cattleyicolor]AEW97610.1 MarR-family transcriptional regulator [Streptantibioticus cattleyicolor NRRL 8057 = DSM 46488]MYS62039.1 MarR family transcriptional regulator [Streptomyces sp. SID5468]CCB77932.1 MarR-family transcriptional regulator [Streptantibioticus cattleyicolor NRRL 8057 = DSM 46488]